MQILTATLVNYKEKEKKTFYFDIFLHHFLSLFLHGARGKVRRLAKSSDVCYMLCGHEQVYQIAVFSKRWQDFTDWVKVLIQPTGWHKIVQKVDAGILPADVLLWGVFRFSLNNKPRRRLTFRRKLANKQHKLVL